MSSIVMTLFSPRCRAAARLVAVVALVLSCAGLSAQSNVVDVCDRTDQVRAVILAAIPAGRCEALSSSDLAGITRLNLASTGIMALRADDFAELTGLRELNLNNNDLSTLPATVFSELTSLQILRLYNNDLSTLPATIFSGLTRLLSLRLHNNDLSTLPEDMLSGLTNLQILDLSNNGLTALPADIFEGLLRLWWLVLSDNGLETLPEGVFSGLTALQYLDLGGNTGSDFRLTVRPRIEFVRLPDGFTSVVARLVLREGAPRPITAALGVTGATLSADSLTIPVGRTESDDVVTITRPLGSSEPLELTLEQLVLGKAAPDSQYRGFVVAAEEAVIDICDRTDEVRAAILAAIPAGRCEALSPSDLDGVTGLDLTNSDSASSGISSLRADDFAGLTGLQTLNLSNNGLDTLPAGVFAGLAGLTGVDLSGNPGATFTLTVRPSFVPSPSPGSFSMKLALREGAPRAVTVRFTATGISLLEGVASVLTIPTGGNESRAVTLNLNPGSTSFGLTLELFALGGEDDDYPGVAVATEASSFGFVNICDRTRVVRAAILDATSTASDACETVSVSELAAITELDLEDAGIRSLQAGDFEGLTGLEILRLDENGLDELHKDVFSGLINLQTLYLHENRLETLPLSVFSGLTSLRTLFLQDNRLRTLPEGVFSELINLETLRLDINKRPTALMLPERIFSGLTKLRRLDLNDNGLSALPANIFSGLENLRLLRLYNNNLRTLPEDIFDGLSSLEELNLRDNRLETLPEGVFDGLRSLVDLTLSNNRLTTLPEGIFDDLVSLESLGLENNDLETLPDGVFLELTNLEGLYLTNNDLETLPADVFSGLTNLENLFLHRNRWKTLPEGIFLGLTNLQAVWVNVVGRNLFTFEPKLEIEPFPLNGDKTTVRLTLRGGAPRSITAEVSPVGVTLSTNFLTIPTGSTESAAVTVSLIPGSTSVSLTVTSITLGGSSFGYLGFGAMVAPVRYTVAGICDRTPQVQSGILAATAADDACFNVSPDDLTEILELDLSSAGIESLQGDDFAGLTGLTKLDLTDNELHELPAGVFSGLTDLTEVRLDSNPGTTFTLTVEAALDVSSSSDGFGVSLKLVSREGVPRLVTAVIPTTAGITLSTNFLTIPTGGVESNLAAITRSPDVTSTTLTWEILTLGGSDDQYPGIRIVTGGRIADTITDVCARTAEVQSELLFRTPSDDTCEAVLVSELAAIDTLQFSYSEITGLQAGDFAHLTGLQTLYLQGNHLNTLPEGVFDGLISLQTLWLHESSLETLPEGVFDGLTSLQILRLDGNRLKTLPEGIFSELTGLQRLDLDSNGLETLPEGVFSGLASLQTLYLFLNNLAVLPADVFSGLDKLRILWLSHNRLSTLPPNVFSGLGELTSLWLHANPGEVFRFTVRPEFTPSPVPDDFTSATVKLVLREGAPRPIEVNLLTLSPTEGATLSTNFVTIPTGAVESAPVTITRSLVTAPFELGFLISEIDYESNRTRGVRIVLGEPVAELTLDICARTAHVRDEILAATPADDTCGRVPVLELAAITELDLAGTRITSLRGGDFAGLTGLQTLNLANNQLTTLPRDVFSMATAPQVLRDMFSSLVNLRDLDLSSNGITFLPDDVFSGLSGLRTLDLSDNLLSSLSAGNLNLPELRVLDLSDNPLTSSSGMSLGMNVFTHLSSLEELYLSGISSFTTGLPAGIFSGLSRLRGLHLPVNDEGAPLATLRFEFVRTDDREAGSLSADVELRVPEGAPFPVQADLDLERLTGPPQVAMATGSTRADAFIVTLTSQVLDGFVTATPPEAPMTSDCQRPSASAPHACYQGVGFPPVARFTIDKATDLPEVTITNESSMVSVKEGDTATVTVRAHRPLSEALTVAYTIGAAAADGRADADRNDYTDVGAGMVTIAAGETTADALIRIDDDSDIEPTREGFRVSLSADASYVLGRSDQITAIVVINEGVCDRATAYAILQSSNPQDCADVNDIVLAEIRGLGFLPSPHGPNFILREGDFDGLDALEDLFLENTTPTFASANVFSGLDTLLALHLEGANLRALPAGIFSGLDALRELDLEGANLGPLPAGIFSAVRDTLRILNMMDVTLEESLPAGIFAGLSLDVLRLPRSAALSLRFNVVEENAPSNPTSARVSVVLAQGAPFALSVDLLAVNAALSTDFLVIPAGGDQSAVFEVRRGSEEEVPVVRFAGDPMTVKEGVTADVKFDVSDRYVMGVFRPTNVTITSTAAAGNVYAADETITAEVTFGDDVHVSTATDGPRLALGIGDQIRFADFAGTRTDTLIFEYEVTRDDYDADGISIGGSALALGVGSAGITDSFGNPVRLELGAHAVGNAAAHKVAGRRLSLSFDPPSVALQAGETVQVRVVLSNAGALLQDVAVHLSPGGGLGADPDVVTFIPGGDVPGDDVVTITVGATVTATAGESSVSASVTQGEQDKIMALVSDAKPLGVRINQRVITVSFEPNPVTLARGGSTKDVIISASPRLESGERFTVAFSGLPGVTVGGDRTLGAGAASQRRLSLSADASVVAGSLTAMMEGAGTFLGVPDVRFDELRVEVVPLVSVEFIPEMVEVVQGRSTMFLVTTSPVLEAGQSATVELTVPADSELTLERTGSGASGVSLTLPLTGPALTRHEIVILSSADAPVGASELTLTVSDGSGVELTPRSLPVTVVWPRATVALEPAAGGRELVLARGSGAPVRLTLDAEPGLLSGQEAVLEVSVEDSRLSAAPDRVTLTLDNVSTEVTVSATPEAAGVVSTLTVTAVSGVRLSATPTLPVRVEREFTLSFEPEAVALIAGGLPVQTTLVLTEEGGSLEPGEEVEVTLTPSMGIIVASAAEDPLATVTLRKDVADAAMRPTMGPTTRIWVSAESDAAPSGSLSVSASAPNAQVVGAALRVSVAQPGGALVEFIPEGVEVVQGHEAVFTVTTNPVLEAGQSATVELAVPPSSDMGSDMGSGLTLEQPGGASGVSLTLLLAGPTSTRHEVVISSSADAAVGDSTVSLTVSDNRGVELTPRSLPVTVVWPRATVALEPAAGGRELVLARGSDMTVRLTLDAEPGLLSGQEVVLEVSVEDSRLSVAPDRVTLTATELFTEVTVSATSEAAGVRGNLRVAAVSGVRLDASALPVRVEREFTLSFDPATVALTAGGLPVPTTLALTEEAGSLAPGEDVEVTLTPSMGINVTSASGEPLTTVTLRKDVAGATTQIRVSAGLDADYTSPGSLRASVAGELDNARVGEAGLPVSVRQRRISMFFEPPEIRQVRGGVAEDMTLPTRVRLRVVPALQSTERLVVDFTPVSGWDFLLYEYTFTSMTESVDVSVIADMNTSSGEIRPSVSVEEGDLIVEFTPLTVEVVRGVRLSLKGTGDSDEVTIIAGESADVTVATEPALEGDERVTVTLSVGDGLATGGNELVLSEANRSATVRVSASVAGLDLSEGLSASGSGGNVEVLDGASLRVVTRDAVEVSVVVSPSSLEVEQGRGATFRVTTEPGLAAGQAATLALAIDPDDAGLSFAGGSFSTTVELVGGESRPGWVDVAVSAALDAAFGSTARITSSLSGKVGVEVNVGARSQARLSVVAPRVSVSFTPADELVLSAGSEGTVTLNVGRGLQGDQEAALDASVEGSGLSVAPRRVTLTATEPSAAVRISARDAGVRGTLTVTAASGVSLLEEATLPVQVEREFALSFDPKTVALVAGGPPVPTTLVLTEEAGSLEPGEEVEVALTPSVGINVASESGEPVTTVTLRKDVADATARATIGIWVSADLNAETPATLRVSASAPNAQVSGTALRVAVLPPELRVLFEPPDVEVVQGRRATFTVTTVPVLEAGESATIELTVVSGSGLDLGLDSGLGLGSAGQSSSNVLTLPLIGPDLTSREAEISAAVTAEPGEFLVASKLTGISGIGAATMQPSLAVSVMLPRVAVEFEPSDELVLRKESERAVTLTLSAASELLPGQEAVFDVTLAPGVQGLSVAPRRVTLTATALSTEVTVSATSEMAAGAMSTLTVAAVSGVSLLEEATLPVRVEREFTLSFEPERVELAAGGLPVPATLRLTVAGSLAADEAVEVTLTPSMGVNVTSDAGEALSRVILTSGAGATARIRIGAGLNADYTIPGFLTAAGSLLPNGLQVGESELAVTVLQREIAVFFEPSKLALVSGGAVTSSSSDKVTLMAEPELQGGETVVVGLNASGDLAARGELTLSPTGTITLSSMMNTVEVSVEAMTGPGVVEVSATVDTAVSSLGNARLSAQPLTVEVVRGVELRLAGHGGLDVATIIADGSTDVAVTTWPPLERDERVEVTLSVSAGLTVEDALSTIAILTGTARSTTVRLSASVPGGPGGFVSASGSGENVVVVGVEPSLPVETRSAAEVAVALSPRELAVQQGGGAVLRVTTAPRLGLGQSVSLTLTITPDDASLSFADGSFSTMVRLIGGEGRSYMAELRVEALPDALIGGMAELSSTVTDVTGVAVSIGAQGRTTLTVATPRVTVGFTPEGDVMGEGLSLDLDSSRKVTLNLTDFSLSGGQTATFEVSVEGEGLTLQSGVKTRRVSLDATDMTVEVTVSASGTAEATGWLVVRAIEGVELSGEARLPIEVFQPVALRLVPPTVSVERGRRATFTVAITPALIADRAATVTLDIQSAGFTFAAGGRQYRIMLAADKAAGTVEVLAPAAIGSTAAVTAGFKAKGVSLTSPRPSLELRATTPQVTAVFDRAGLVLAKGDAESVEIRLTDYDLTIPGQEIVLSVQGTGEGVLTLGAAMQPRVELVLSEASPTTIVMVNAVAAGMSDLVVAAVSGAGLTEEARLEVEVLPGVAAQFDPAGIELEQGRSTTFSVALTPPLQAGRLATVTLTAPAGLSFSDSSSLTLRFAGDETTRHEVVVRANADAPPGAAEIRSSLTGSTGGDPAPSQPSLKVSVSLAQVAVEFGVTGTVVLTVGTTMDVTVRLRADHGLQAGQEAVLNLSVDGDGLTVAPARVTLTAAMPSTTVGVFAQTAGVEGFLTAAAASGVSLLEETTLPVLVRREFILSFDPPSLAEAPAIGSIEEVTLKLRGSALNAGESLGVALQPSTSLSVSRSSVTLTMGGEDVLIGISLKEGVTGTQTLTAFATEFGVAGTVVSTVGTTMDVTVTELLNARVHPATLEVPAPMRGVRLRLRVFLEGALE